VIKKKFHLLGKSALANVFPEENQCEKFYKFVADSLNMRLLLVFSFLLAAIPLAFAQGPKTLNAYADYANQSAGELNSIFETIADYYPTLFTKGGWDQPRYVCPVQPDEYYYNKAVQSPQVSQALFTALKDLHAAAEQVDRKCKELDTYHKLEDYKYDKYAAAERMVAEMQALFSQYSAKQNSLSIQLSKEYQKLNIGHTYNTVANLMRKELDRERNFLNKWNFNLKEEIPTGWIEDELRKSISETDESIKRLKELKPVLKYPASSMWPSFQEALSSILDIKRHALDEYNFEATKSDKHRNDVYLSLINYYNGALLSDYNTFLNFAISDNFSGLKAIHFVPMFEINSKEKSNDVTVTPFKDIPRSPVSPPKRSVPISKNAYRSLVNYVEFINETWRQVSNHKNVIRNLNSSASYYASLTSYQGKGFLSFRHDDFQVPFSSLQKAVAESKNISPPVAASLNAGAENILNILKEMDDIGAVLEQEVSSKKYQQDKVAHVYELLARTYALFETWDERKELLYNDIQKVYDSYPVGEPTSSWNISGKSLRQLATLDHEGLFKAKDFYKGKSSGPISTTAIDEKLRDVLSREYDNMKGIEKYGRYNGLCPYSPYEDIPKNSRTFSESLNALKLVKPNSSSDQHPYHSIVYLYNEIVDDYNKFCELSPAPLIPSIHQPELFIMAPPQEQKPESVRPVAVPIQQPSNSSSVVKTDEKAVRTTHEQEDLKAVHDTVYIEQRDTIYLHDPSENVRSMEGYATNNMVLLLDVSGSMNSPGKLPLLKQSVLDMLSMMRTEDQISIVIFSGKPKVLLTSTSFKNEEKIRDAVNSLKPSGKTDGNAGLKLAYKVADENYIRGGNNRIVLATDGEFPIDSHSEELITKFSREDIFLTVFNFGNKSMTGKNLEKISTLGKGNYEFISKENVDLKLMGEAKAKRKK
jgi:Ca-activated chloride channel homolog